MSYRLHLLLLILCTGYRGVGSTDEFASPPIGSHFNADAFVCSSFRSLRRFTEPEVRTACDTNRPPPLFKTPHPMESGCNNFAKGSEQVYPDDFRVRSKVCIDSTTSDEYRYIISNGVANHGITNNENSNAMCEIPWFIKIPKDGQYLGKISQVQQMGILGMAVNGVPMYGPKESESKNAVDPKQGFGKEPVSRVRWSGHASPAFDWHYHSPQLFGVNAYPNASDVVGYALDGFPIYGPLEGDKEHLELVLDKCNGRFKGGHYRYHLRKEQQVYIHNQYCNVEQNGEEKEISAAWNYILGCFHGNLSSTVVAPYVSVDLNQFVCDPDSNGVVRRASELGFTVGPNQLGECPLMTGSGIGTVVAFCLGTLGLLVYGYRRWRRDSQNSGKDADRRLRPNTHNMQKGAFPEDGVPVTPSNRARAQQLALAERRADPSSTI